MDNWNYTEEHEAKIIAELKVVLPDTYTPEGVALFWKGYHQKVDLQDRCRYGDRILAALGGSYL